MSVSTNNAMPIVDHEQLDPPRDRDHALVERCRRGDHQAFADLMAQHQERVGRLAYRLLGWPGEVEDVVQDVFVTAWEKLPQYRGDAALGAWLAAITLSKCRDHQRRQQRRRWLTGWLAPAREPTAPPAMELAANRERSRRVLAAVRRLGPADREVIVLRHLEGREFVEISALLGIDVNAVRVRLHRAQRRLRKLLPEVEE